MTSGRQGSKVPGNRLEKIGPKGDKWKTNERQLMGDEWETTGGRQVGHHTEGSWKQAKINWTQQKNKWEINERDN